MLGTKRMFEIGYMTALFVVLGIGVLGFVLGSLAAFVLWMKSENRLSSRATSRSPVIATSSSRWKIHC